MQGCRFRYISSWICMMVHREKESTAVVELRPTRFYFFFFWGREAGASTRKSSARAQKSGTIHLCGRVNSSPKHGALFLVVENESKEKKKKRGVSQQTKEIFHGDDVCVWVCGCIAEERERESNMKEAKKSFLFCFSLSPFRSPKRYEQVLQWTLTFMIHRLQSSFFFGFSCVFFSFRLSVAPPTERERAVASIQERLAAPLPTD